MKWIPIFCLVFLFSGNLNGEDVFRIEFERRGDSYKKYSNQELRRRVWELERAVWQLQQRVFHLEGQKQVVADSWVCTLSPFSRTYTATGGSKAVATHNVIEKCTAGEKSGFHCKRPKCHN